jgi:hypothetical protein
MIKQWFRSLVALLCIHSGRCTSCYRRLKCRDKIYDRVDYMICEYDSICVYCDSVQDTFSYGNNERDLWRYLAEQEHPILAKILTWMEHRRMRGQKSAR